MTKVVNPGQFSASNALRFGVETDGSRGSMMVTKNLKRKIPSELRGELLRKKSSVDVVDEATSLTGVLRKADERFCGASKCDSSKGSRYTRINEHYPVTKINRLLCQKENIPKEANGNSFSSNRMDSRAENQELKNSCPIEMATSSSRNDSSNLSKDSLKRIKSTSFRSVRDLSLGGEKLDPLSPLTMSIYLKRLGSHETHAVPSSSTKEATNTSGKFSPQSCCSELVVPGWKIPLDLTLKTSVRLLSSSSVNWVHRLMNCAPSNFIPLFNGASTSSGDMHSWLYPQSTLPREVISTLESAPGDFLSKRRQSWEDSFRSLYYMFRKKICRIFYVCSSQFIVMFALSECLNRTKSSCYAYIPQSTRTLRSLLKQHDVYFSMPLCFSKVEEAAAEDLVELSEMEKHNLGQVRKTVLVTGVDNTSQSLLMFKGNKSVHALYDFLLNYRSFMATLSGGDVPVLISPVPFENAALSAPEVKCKQVRRVDYMTIQNVDNSSAGMCFSVEIKDTFIPPWVVCGICHAMRANKAEFEASFVIDPMSNGFNIAMDQTPEEASADGAGQKVDDNDNDQQHFGISNTTLSLRKHAAYLKGLKYRDGSYMAFLSPFK